ncbi:transcriptional initiation protein Tat [Pseudomonas daroniae]|uniref:Transcriptional initiation protein Tat n=1 Tax=Phytopseudomonas daroniae TaxID=2487519 RepID=A0A4Q9QNP7_9GAMM|nr:MULTISPECIES: PhoX family phosphatase [Pseudomonas]TBU75431.1 transcriptional initiation protein Tat [Pseudomonas daroniae]TBU81611.1 transcriptional initiation protein Tat [Pseudomonas daroniae]TBU84224.1 transcriptional initiation protein Tat [Pseudomonas sp. FRB 228]TBU88551.1 transcriptional initiation protein Tat [Pseudomonas daroniae]
MHDEQPTDLERLTLSRRRFIGAGALTGAALFLGGGLLGRSALADAIGTAVGSPLMGFDNIAASSADTITLPPGYSFRTLISWGQPLHDGGPAFKGDGSNSTAEQLLQFGDNTDGMSFFPWPGDADRALMAINNEYVNYRYLLPHGELPKSAEDVRKAQNAEGVTVIEVRRGKDGWAFVQGSPYNRRVHANLPIEVSGPARGHDLLKTQSDPLGTEVLGTFQNCSSGQTPWGTYLTCEENFSDCFGSTDAQLAFTPDQKRFSVVHDSVDNEWHRFDPRFDLARNPNELHRHGWIVEIDPFDPQSKPIKRTALGRFKHENAALNTTRDGRVVVYMGDDERGEFIYKFITRDRLNRADAKANRHILDHGTLYVARFDGGDGDADHPKGRGRWIELSAGKNGLTAEHGFANQADVVIRARQAGTQVGATRMDRPEWITVSPQDGQVYCTLTNNSKRGEEGQPVGGPNPRANNLYGQILRWREEGDDAAAQDFEWDLFVVAGNPVVHPGTAQAGSHAIDADNMFNSPDGVGFDGGGRLWIQTDGKYSNSGDYAGMGNNQMLCADPRSGEIRRFMVGPVGCEVTGLAFSPDYTTMFVGIQHPGEEGGSSFPDHRPGVHPRSSVMVISRDDGGVIGA